MLGKEGHPRIQKVRNVTSDFFAGTSNEKVNTVRREILKGAFFVSSTIAVFETRDMYHPPDLYPVSTALGSLILYALCRATEKEDKKVNSTNHTPVINPDFSTNIIVSEYEDSYLGKRADAEELLKKRMKTQRNTDKP